MRKIFGVTLVTFSMILVPLSTNPSFAAPEFDTYIIVLKSGDDKEAAKADRAAAKNEFSKAGGRIDREYSSVFSGFAIYLPVAAAAALVHNPKVQSIERDSEVTMFGVQSPAPSWGLDRIDQRSLPLSGSFLYSESGKGEGVRAYIVDTGVLSTHTEFTGRMAPGYTAIADNNGTEDCNGHGTHVAGTVAGTTYGVAKMATIVPVRVLDCAGSGTISGVIAGLDFVARDHTSGPAVVNMSLGGGASTTLDTAVVAVINDGVSVVVAAGNSNRDACRFSPARVPAAVTVGATTSTDTRASYSNIGKCLDLFAPGSVITSAWYNSTTAINTLSGTSMASPHVAGVAAVLLSRTPSLTPAEISGLITSTATTGVVTSAGKGSPNLLLYSAP